MADRLCNNTARLDADLSLDEISLNKLDHAQSSPTATDPEPSHDLDLHNPPCNDLDINCGVPSGVRFSHESDLDCELQEEGRLELEQELLQSTDAEGLPVDPGRGSAAPGLASLRGRRYGGTVIDKMISFLADLIKLIEIRLLRMLYRRRDERIVLKTQAIAAREREATEGIEPLVRPRKRRRFAPR